MRAICYLLLAVVMCASADGEDRTSYQPNVLEWLVLSVQRTAIELSQPPILSGGTQSVQVDYIAKDASVEITIMHTPEAKVDSLYSVGFLKDRMRLKLFNVLEEMKRTNQPMSNKLDRWHSDLVDRIAEFDSSIIYGAKLPFDVTVKYKEFLGQEQKGDNE